MAHHNEQEPLDPQVLFIYRKMATEFADRYIETFLTPQLERATGQTVESVDQWVDILDQPEYAVRTFLGNYAYARRGKDRDTYSRISLKAIDQILESATFEEILKQPDGILLWNAFVEQCEKRDVKPNESQNRGVVQGLLELAQEIYQIDQVGSICAWVADCIEQTGHIEPQFNRIVDIRGVGPKNSSTFLRDMVFVYDMERQVAAVDRIHIQPIDRWTRLAAKYCVPEPQDAKMPDWIVAGKVNKYARRAQVSGIRFNLGLTFFGQRVVKNPERFDREMKQLLANPT